MPQLIFLIIFASIAVINTLIRNSAKTQARKPGPGTPPQAPQRQTQAGGQAADDERLRKFMEALGVPSGAAPPPRQITRPQQALPRAQPPVRRQVAPRQVVARKVFTPPPVPMQAAYQAETVSTQASVATGYDVATSSPPSAAVAGVTSAGVPAPSTGADLKSLLRSSSSIRVAILLKEILGSPRGLQQMDVIPGLR